MPQLMTYSKWLQYNFKTALSEYNFGIVFFLFYDGKRESQHMN